MTARQTSSSGSGFGDAVSLSLAALDRFPTSLLALLFRLGAAGVFFKSGLTKVTGFPPTLTPSTLFLFENEFQVPLLPPDLAALLATGFELACPVLLVLGLATRLAALPLLGMTAVIELFVYPLACADHLQWTALLLYILVRGPGRLSLDALIAPSLFKRFGIQRRRY